MPELEPVEDPRIHPDICGITVTHGRTEFVCIKAPHQQLVKRRNAAYPEPRNNPTSEAHYFVNRYPNRPRQDA